MIDRNNIIEAAEQAFANINTPYSSCMKIGFQRGVNWFKHAIWHDASEMPEKGKAFIFLAESNSLKHYHVGVVYNPMDYDKNCEWWGLIEWCYIEDLLPKGGDV